MNCKINKEWNKKGKEIKLNVTNQNWDRTKKTFKIRNVCLSYNNAASHATAVSCTFKYMKVGTLSYNGAAAATSFKNFGFAALGRQYKSKIGKYQRNYNQGIRYSSKISF